MGKHEIRITEIHFKMCVPFLILQYMFMSIPRQKHQDHTLKASLCGNCKAQRKLDLCMNLFLSQIILLRLGGPSTLTDSIKTSALLSSQTEDGSNPSKMPQTFI
jgi:hypothetical protein